MKKMVYSFYWSHACEQGARQSELGSMAGRTPLRTLSVASEQREGTASRLNNLNPCEGQLPRPAGDSQA